MHIFITARFSTFNLSFTGVASRHIVPVTAVEATRLHPHHDRASHGGQCGNWQERYIAHHASILSGREPPRFAVSVHHSGLADNLTKAVWVFYFALLTNRAFILGFPPSQQAKFEWAYDAPWVNWTDGRHLLDLVDLDKPSGPQQSGIFLFNDLVSWNSSDEDVKLFANGDVTSMAEQSDTVVFWKGTGQTFRLFDNPYHRNELQNMGLRPDIAVGCALNFLFEPNTAVKTLFRREIQALSQPSTLKIGVQIRTSSYSDAAFFDKDKAVQDLSFWDPWFECAQQIEDSNLVRDTGVLWYLISDSQPLREYAKAKYGDKLCVTMPGDGMTLDHSTWGSSGYDGFISAAGENWLFGMTDYQVVTGASNFGKIGAMRSMGWHNLYSFWVKDDSVGRLGSMESRQCDKNDYEHLEDVSARWFGI